MKLKKNGDRKWWETFNEFAPLVKDFPAGVKLEYFYGPEKSVVVSPTSNGTKPPYQALIKLFNGAIQGFSCFVGDGLKIDFRSTRCNYDAIKPGEGFVHDNNSLWVGGTDVLMGSAQILANAFSEMKRRGYNVDADAFAGNHRREVRIICPERGALVGSLLGNDSLTIFVDNVSLEQMVKPYLDRRSN